MTVALSASEILSRFDESLRNNIKVADATSILVEKESLVELINFLKATPGLDFDYLATITAVDYWDYFEVIYQLTSISHNHSLVIKTRCQGRDNLSLPSITAIYQAADYQEREIHDLLGIHFEGHPNLKRIFLWEGFQGFPLRKDYL